jgi:KamA family protein
MAIRPSSSPQSRFTSRLPQGAPQSGFDVLGDLWNNQSVSGEPYKAVNLKNLESIPQITRLPEELRWNIQVVGHVLPFKSNRYVIDHLIDWDDVPNDAMFRLTFPQREMLDPVHFDHMAQTLDAGADAKEIKRVADEIRMTLNPHPAGQMEHNVPRLDGQPLNGMQHKYRETVLFFPSQGQTCHAYCTFCFRWPQFVGLDGQKFAMHEGELLKRYVEAHPEVTDVLFTGGDPMIMKTKIFKTYLEPLLEPGAAQNVRTIRIGSKALAYWPQRFVSDDDADELLALLRRVVQSGRQLAFMAHFNHPRELESPVALEAVRRLRNAGVQIRTQTPILKHINADADTLSRMWQKQTEAGLVPYYLFVARDTGAQRYFELPLDEAWETYRQAIQQVSGLARTVRGPSMSATPGKVRILGVSETQGEKVFVLDLLQARDPDWVGRPFFAKYDADARWLDDLKPAFGEQEFFYEAALRDMLAQSGSPWSQEPGAQELGAPDLGISTEFAAVSGD